MKKSLSKKIVKFNGGLGNQMFQYAFALSLADKFKITPSFDFSWFEDVKNEENVVPRAFDLNIFNLKYDVATAEDLTLISRAESDSKLKKSIMKIFPVLFGVNHIREKHTFQFDSNIANSSNYSFYEGYFQHEKYFKHLRKQIIETFTLKIPLDEKNEQMLAKISNCNSVSLHIRRGDYITLEHANKTHGLCPLDYYAKAVEFISKRVENPHFFIFSDDIQWVIQNFKIEFPFTVVDFNNEKGWFDMELMKNCKHNIIANSSFSWWAAWLNKSPEKAVIAPKKWLATKQKCDIVPKEWIKL